MGIRFGKRNVRIKDGFWDFVPCSTSLNQYFGEYIISIFKDTFPEVSIRGAYRTSYYVALVGWIL
jgi:hypothetical protein